MTRPEILLGLLLLAIAITAGLPRWSKGRNISARAEVPLVVDALVAAQVAHHDKHGSWFRFGPAPRPSSELDPGAVPWGQSLTGSFSPPLPRVRGSYTVSIEDGRFVVTGRCDVDGDGTAAVYTATYDRPTRRETPAYVY